VEKNPEMISSKKLNFFSTEKKKERHEPLGWHWGEKIMREFSF